MRNMSFALTTDQVRDRTKTVTRRVGWKALKVGQLIRACVKCMGLKPGEQIDRLAILRVKDVRREPLALCNDADAKREGFPQMDGAGFRWMFCEHMGGNEEQIVTRIEFQYIVGGRHQ